MKKADLILTAVYLPYISPTAPSKGYEGNDGRLYLEEDLSLLTSGVGPYNYELLYSRETKYGTSHYYAKKGG